MCLQDESFLEDINMILNTGDIPNLYDNEERLEIIEKVHWLNLCSIYCRKTVFVCLRLIEMTVILSVCYGNSTMFVYILNDFKLDECTLFAWFQMQQLALQQNLQMEMTPLNMYNMFIERIRRNLHVVLAFSPIGDNFRNRIRMFPSLINCCTIDWFKVSLNCGGFF